MLLSVQKISKYSLKSLSRKCLGYFLQYLRIIVNVQHCRSGLLKDLFTQVHMQFKHSQTRSLNLNPSIKDIYAPLILSERHFYRENVEACELLMIPVN